MNARIYDGMEVGRKIRGATLVRHPFGLAIVKNGQCYGVVDIDAYPQYRAGLCATVSQPYLTRSGWGWGMREHSPLFNSVKAAVEWALAHLEPQPCSQGIGVFAEFPAIVGAEFGW
jgi:hypothetical protein